MKLSIKVKFLNFLRSIFKIKALESFLAAKTQNKLPSSFICKLVPNPYQYASGTKRTVCRKGLTLEVDISDYIGHYLFFGFLDKGIDNLFSLCEENYNVIDIGANIGWVALNLAQISKTGTVIGFEPDPFNYDACKRNVELNTLPNLTILPYGLGEISNQVNMEVRTPENRGGNRVAPAGGKGSHVITVKRLDELPVINSLHMIHLIKLDVEGYELKVLRGSQGILKKFKPTLFIELDDLNLRDQGDSAEGVVSFLEANGYDSIRNAESNEKITVSTDFSYCHFDIIAH